MPFSFLTDDLFEPSRFTHFLICRFARNSHFILILQQYKDNITYYFIMEKILVQDNFLNNEELEKAVSIIKSGTWQFGHTSDNSSLVSTPFWIMNLNENEYFSIFIKDIIEKQFSKKFKLDRVYANGHTFGQDGSYHIDNSEPNTYTFCLYLSEIRKKYIDTAGGHLFFKLPDLNYKICYEPIYNRGIFFPSNYVHKACSYTRFIMDMRISVAWKLTEII